MLLKRRAEQKGLQEFSKWCEEKISFSSNESSGIT